MIKVIPRSYVVYTFSPKNKPFTKVKPGDKLIFETIDALGGQIKDESITMDSIDWSKVNGVTGPVYVESAEPGDTLVVKILDITLDDTGFIIIVPGFGVLGKRVKYRPHVKIVKIINGYAYIDSLKLPIKPMVGTIGVSPHKEVPTGTLGRYGGNMDVKELGRGAVLYLPVFVKGALLAMGDVHALQSDGELCVSAIEVSARVTVEIDVIRGRQSPWPILETKNYYAYLIAGKTLDEAVEEAAYVATQALSKAMSISFEKAYMLTSLIVDVKINQVVDPLKGVRATIPKDLVDLEDLLYIK